MLILSFEPAEGDAQIAASLARAYEHLCHLRPSQFIFLRRMDLKRAADDSSASAPFSAATEIQRFRHRLVKSIEPMLEANDKRVFYQYLNRCTHYFEFGSGGSTYQASLTKNILRIHSVESDRLWYNKISRLILHPNFTYIFNDMDAAPNTYGHPGAKGTDDQKRRYSSRIVELSAAEKETIDFVLIDGRFRVACCLKTFGSVQENCRIAFDDFTNREWYHIVLEYFDIAHEILDRMVILKKKPGIAEVPRDVIAKYELDAR